MSNQTGHQFSLSELLAARELTIALVHDVAAEVRPGMNTAQVEAVLDRELTRRNIVKLWHPSKVRLGVNTLKTFRESNEDVVIKEGDLFFLDLGPVYHDHEGDYGETFVCGRDLHGHGEVIAAVSEIFEITKKAWQKQELSGEALYQVAQDEAQKRGLELNASMGGHRVGDFPHALHYKGQLLPYDSVPDSGLWILEILVKSTKRGVGAFFEDLLIK